MEFTNEIENATAPIYKKIAKVLPEIEWPTFAPYIYRINKLNEIYSICFFNFLL